MSSLLAFSRVLSCLKFLGVRRRACDEVFMIRLFSIGFLGFGAFLSQLANAAECETQYVNTGVFEIKDTTAYGGASAVGFSYKKSFAGD